MLPLRCLPISQHITPKKHIRELSAEKINHTTYVRSALSAGPLPYERGWAWQHVLLNRRLRHLRLQERQDKKQENQEYDWNYVDNNNSSNNNNAPKWFDYNKDCVLLFEHKKVYTMGRGASEDHLTFLNQQPDGGDEMRRRLNRKYRGDDASRLNMDQFCDSDELDSNAQEEVDRLLSKMSTSPVYAPNDAPIYRIERGGEVTYHGPGQLVVYPLLNLNHPAYKQDLHWYLRQIEEVIILTLKEFDIDSYRDSINTGVWVGKNKIAAVGVSASRWITTHGFAINVCPDLSHFDTSIITPCGIEERGVTSIQNVLEDIQKAEGVNCPSVKEVADVSLRCFSQVFEVELTEGDQIR